MDVTVSIPTILRPLTQQQKQLSTQGSTIQELIQRLEQDYPGIQARLVSDGKAHRFVNIYVNDNDIRFADNLATTLKSGDHITILPAVAGG